MTEHGGGGAGRGSTPAGGARPAERSAASLQPSTSSAASPPEGVRPSPEAIASPCCNATGLALAERYGLSIYDAMIAAFARHAECDTLWSEDMHDSIVIQDQLRIANPFHPG